MKIEKIKKMPSGKYKIVLNNDKKIVTYDDVILKNGLLFSKEINEEVLNTLEIDTQYYDLYHKMVSFISRRLRSEKEVREYLDKYTTIEKDKNKIIQDLKQLGLVNDHVFAHAYVSDRMYLSTSGPYKIKSELLEHDILESVIDEELSKIDSNDILNKIEKIIQKKAKSNTKYSEYFFKKKLFQELSTLGYDKDMITSSLEGIKMNNVIEKEVDKLFQKYQSKKEGKELLTFMKQKLYQKGFKMEEIQEAINKKMEN